MDTHRVAIVDQPVKLGKQKRVFDKRTLKLGKYVKLPRVPLTLLQTPKIEPQLTRGWGMMGNDSLGDCTCAGVGHAVQVWTALNEATKGASTPTDAQVEALYWSTGTADNGRSMMGVLDYVKKNGLAGHGIGAYALVKRNHRDVRAAINLFGCIYIGVNLPKTAQGQTEWRVTGRGPDSIPGSWGGHAIILVDYDGSGPTCITWGKKLKMTWGFFNKYCDEAYAIIAPDFLEGGKSPAGFNAAQLQKDLDAIT